MKDGFIDYTPLLELATDFDYGILNIYKSKSSYGAEVITNKVYFNYNSIFMKQALGYGTVSHDRQNILVGLGLKCGIDKLQKLFTESVKCYDTEKGYLNMLPPDYITYANTYSEGVYFFIDTLQRKAWLEVSYEFISLLEEDILL